MIRHASSFLLAAAAIVFAQMGCRKSTQAQIAIHPLAIESESFSAGGTIPAQFTCDGADLSPALSWSAPPPKTQSQVLIVNDPDAAGSFTHWEIYNLPANLRRLSQGIPAQEQLPNGALQGHNGFGKTGYSGPCPPGASFHHYVFRLYALDSKISLPDATPEQLERAMEGHILAQGEIIGLYRRSR